MKELLIFILVLVLLRFVFPESFGSKKKQSDHPLLGTQNNAPVQQELYVRANQYPGPVNRIGLDIPADITTAREASRYVQMTI